MKKIALLAFALTCLLGVAMVGIGFLLTSFAETSNTYAMNAGGVQAVAAVGSSSPATSLTAADFSDMNYATELAWSKLDVSADGGDATVAMGVALPMGAIVQPEPEAPAPLPSDWMRHIDTHHVRALHVFKVHQSRFFVHIVRRHETLSGIALRFGTTVRTLARLNGICHVNLIQTGRRLLIPR